MQAGPVEAWLARALENQIAALRAEADAEAGEVNYVMAQEAWAQDNTAKNSQAMARFRGGKNSSKKKR